MVENLDALLAIWEQKMSKFSPTMVDNLNAFLAILRAVNFKIFSKRTYSCLYISFIGCDVCLGDKTMIDGTIIENFCRQEKWSESSGKLRENLRIFLRKFGGNPARDLGKYQKVKLGSISKKHYKL